MAFYDCVRTLINAIINIIIAMLNKQFRTYTCTCICQDLYSSPRPMKLGWVVLMKILKITLYTRLHVLLWLYYIINTNRSISNCSKITYM